MNSRRRAREWPIGKHKQFSTELREAAAAWFRDKGYQTHPRMHFCLANWENWKANIIVEEVARYIADRSADAQRRRVPFPLHKYLHHGMSSQAMAFNLIGPLVTRHDYAPLVALLDSKHVPGAHDVAVAVFEYEDREVFNEDTGQPTSIDIVLKDSIGRPFVFIESKLDERGFGGCSVFSAGDCSGINPIGQEDACFLHFIGRKYWSLMEKYGITEALSQDRQCIFTVHYQFFREVLLALEKGGVFVLLSDDRSPVFQYSSGNKARGLMPFLTSVLPEGIRSKVVSISIQEIVAEIEKRKQHEDWIHEFKTKYAIA